MKEQFNGSAGISPEASRSAYAADIPELEHKSMVQQEQLTPQLKPYSAIAKNVDRKHHNSRLLDERKQLQRYQMKVVELHTRTYFKGQLINETVDKETQMIHRDNQVTNDFNINAGQAFDIQQLQLQSHNSLTL